MHITIEQFAKQSGLSATIISKRIRRGDIDAEAIILGGRLRFMIDTLKYDPKRCKEGKAGRPAKAKN